MAQNNEVVISGLAGHYPGASNSEDLWKILIEGQDVISYETDTSLDALNTPKYKGKLAGQKYFDYMMFGIHSRLAEKMDINTCFILEAAFSAIFNAGVNPYELSGKNILVVVGSGQTKYDIIYSCERANSGFTIVGGSQCMMANRLSHTLNLKGPSYNVEGSWNGILEGLKYAQAHVATGMAEAAIVGCTNLENMDESSFHYKQLGRLNEDGKTKSFSDDADGYTRSEACVVFYLQRKQDARRIYGTVLDCTIGDCFNKNMPPNDLYAEDAVKVLKKTYDKFPNLIKELSFMECSGDGLKYWDQVELNSIANVLLKERDKPLLIGSVKSNVGHCEDANIGVALVKALYTFDRGVIPPNLHFSSSNSDVPALKSGALKVVTEPTKLEGDFIGINTYSRHGSLSHLIIQRNPKTKKREPKVGVLPDGLPILYVASARHELGIKHILKTVEEMPIDEEFIALSHKLFRNVIRPYPFRGYTILNEKGEVLNGIKEYNMYKRPIWFVFSGMGSQWTGMGIKLMEIPIFANAVHKCHEILKPLGINLIDVITTTDPTVYDNILNSFVGIAAVQIGLVDILNAIGLVPDGILGHSVGELGCAYADGCFTAEQMILAAYARGKASLDAELIPGMMAAVGMGYNDIKDQLPEGIDVACRNSAISCTLSGPTLLMEEYVASIKAKGVFAKLVNASNIAYHSRYIQPAAPALLESLKKVIPEPKKRTSKWISTSVPKKDWGNETAMFSSAEYHTNNLLGSVLFEDASELVPKDAIVIEIAPHGLLQAILKKSMPDAIHIPLTHRAQPDGVIYLLTALGKLYLEGVLLDIDKLYPPVEFPVSRGTPSLEPFLFWNHFLPVTNSPKTIEAQSKTYSKNITIELNDEKYSYLKDFTVNGQQYIPPSIYLDLVIDHYRANNETNEPIVIEDFKVKCNPKITDGLLQLHLSLQNGLGDWEICQESVEISHGHKMRCIKAFPTNGQLSVDGSIISKHEVYSYLSSKGVEIGTSCQLIQSLTVSEEGSTAQIIWNGNWVTFLDSILLLYSLLEADESSKLKLPNSIQRIIIDYENLNFELQKEITVSFEKTSGLIYCEGFEIACPKMKHANVPKRQLKEVVCNTLKFIPYLLPNTSDTVSIFDYSLEIIVQNLNKAASVPKLYIIEVNAGMDLHQQILKAVNKKNGIKFDILKVRGAENIKECGSEDECFAVLIVSTTEDLNNPIKIIKQVEHGYLLLLNQTPPPSLLPILQQKNASDSFSLCKVNSNISVTPNIVLLSDPFWRRHLEIKLSQDNSLVYLVGKSESLPSIHKFIEECEKMTESARIRYVFFDKETFDLSKHGSQLAKDLKINIHYNGHWCTYGCSSSIINPDHPMTDSDIFPFSNIRCPGINLSTLGVNLADVSGVEKKIGVIEFVGEKDGRKVCGLAEFSPKTKTLHPDHKLFWPKPKNWSDNETASVLLAYSMAYYILKVDNNLELKKTIYVSEAVHPISQAIIRIALNCKLEVFTSYNDSKQKDWICQNFPEIPKNNLIDTSFKQIDVMMKIKLGNKRMDIIVNTLSDPCMVEKSIGLVAFNGKCYQVSLSPLKEDEKIGLFIFLNQNSITGLNPESLLMINDDEKEKLRHFVAEGLQSREIKPLPYEQLTNKHLNINGVSLLRERKSFPTKLLVNMENKLPANTSSPYFTASPDNSYLIIGDTMNMWFQICEWLIKRGAQNLYLVLRKHSFSSSSNQQLNRLLHSNPLLKLNLISLKRIKDKESIDSTMKEINTTHRLSAVFVIGEENEGIVKNLCASKERFLLISLLSGGEAECETRSASGLPSLAISAPNELFKSNLILPTLDNLIAQEKPVVYLSELKETQVLVHDLMEAEYFPSLPSTSADLLQLINNSERASWKEVRTSGLTYVHSREISPVFIISTLRKSHFKKFIAKLIHPAFEAIIPSHCTNMTDIANQLVQGILKFNINEITLMCSDWAWSIGFAMAQLLEEEDKTISLVVFDSSAKRSSKSIIGNYVYHMKFKFLRNEEENISKGLQVLENRLDFLHLPMANGPNKYKGFLHIVVPDSERHLDISTMQQNCERPIKIHAIPSTNLSSMLSAKKTEKLVNSLVLYEHKTAGRKIKKQYYEYGIMEYSRRTFGGIERTQ